MAGEGVGIGSTRPGREHKQQIPPSQPANPALSRYMTSEVCVSQSSSLNLSPWPWPRPPRPLSSSPFGLLHCVMTPLLLVFYIFIYSFAVQPLTPCPVLDTSSLNLLPVFEVSWHERQVCCGQQRLLERSRVIPPTLV